MKKIISIITAFLLCLCITDIRISAKGYISYSTEGEAAVCIKNYIGKYSGSIDNYIKKALKETNFYSTDEISGEIKISCPISYITVSQEENGIEIQEISGSAWLAVINNDNVIGLIRFDYYSNGSISLISYIPVSEKACRSINTGCSFYFMAYVADCCMSVTPDDEVSVAYFDSSFDEEGLRLRDLNILAGKETVPSFKQVSKYNFINSDTEIIHSFEYVPEGEKNITDGDPFYISCSDRYLTYSDGKLALSEYSGSDNQKFILSRQESGCYSIAPSNAPDRKIKVGGTDEFKINLAYLNEYCYCVSKPGDGLTMTAKGNGIVFAKYNSSKYNLSDQKWIIKKNEK